MIKIQTPAEPIGEKRPIDRPCSACSAGDSKMEYHNHYPPFRAEHVVGECPYCKDDPTGENCGCFCHKPTVSRSTAVAGETRQHNDLRELVFAFSTALLDKLVAAEAKYSWKGGWQKEDWADDLRRDIRKHVEKGDSRDVAAYCAFAWYHEWSLAIPAVAAPEGEAKRKVFTISVLSGLGKEWRFCDWGYYFAEADARKVIEENQTDISELGYYQYGILSAKGEGPFAIAQPIQWYEFIWREGKFVRADKITMPPQYEHEFLPVQATPPTKPVSGAGMTAELTIVSAQNFRLSKHQYGKSCKAYVGEKGNNAK